MQGKVDFVGIAIEGQGEYSSKQTNQLALAKVDMASGSVQMMPAEGRRIIRMEPRVHGIKYGNSETGTNMEADLAARYAQNRRYVPEQVTQQVKHTGGCVLCSLGLYAWQSCMHHGAMQLK